MRLLSLSPPMIFHLSLRSPNVYDPLQIFLQEAGSQEIKLVMVQSALSSIFIMDDSHLSTTCVRFSIYHPSHSISHGNKFHLHLSHDASVVLSRPPPWPDWDASWGELSLDRVEFLQPQGNWWGHHQFLMTLCLSLFSLSLVVFLFLLLAPHRLYPRTRLL